MLAFAEGKRMGAIAADLNLSVKTVSTYKRRLLDKLELHTTADLVRYVLDRRLA
jgi:DNA-binding NarL/FixJ family response regulator